MSRSRRGRSCLLPLAAALLALAGCAPAAPARPPDIVLISLDSVRADDLTFRDERAAPALTALARRGTIFTEAIAGSSWTLPGHAEMFTGSPPALNGVSMDTITLDPLQPTLPELLHAHGYRTAGFFTGGYLDPRYGFGRGFDTYEDCQTQAPGAPTSNAPQPGEQPAERGTNGISGPAVVAHAEAMLQALPADQPLFLFAHIFDPHYDYIPPPPWDTLFDPDYKGDIDPRDYWHNKRIYDASKNPPRQVSDRDLQHLRALYRGEIAWTDSNVGKLLDALARHGRLQNALIVVTSDHGEEFFEHGNRGHRSTLFDEVLRVPLLIVPPAGGGGAMRAAGSVEGVAEQVSLSDVAPTLLDFAGAAPPPSMSGISLRAAVFGASPPRRAVYSSLCVPSTDNGVPGLWLTECLRWPESKFKLVFRYEKGSGLKLRGAKLFDLRADPGETASPPLEHGDAELAQQWAALEGALDGLRSRYAASPHSADGARELTRSPAADETLRALGYVGADGGPSDATDLRLPWGLGPRMRLPPPK